MNYTLRDLINGMQYREGMYVTPANYENVISFLNGFSVGLKAAGHPSELDDFQEWVEQKMGHSCASHWSGLIKEEFAKGDSGKALVLLYSFLNDFLNQDQKQEKS